MKNSLKACDLTARCCSQLAHNENSPLLLRGTEARAYLQS